MGHETEGMHHNADQPPRQRRRSQRPRTRGSNGRWSDPASKLQAARFERGLIGQQVVDAIHTICPGHSGQPCRLDASKLSEHETGSRRPGTTHIEAYCRFYQKSAEELGLITWRDEPPDTGTAAEAPTSQPIPGVQGEDAAASGDILLGLLAITLQPNVSSAEADSAQPTEQGGADGAVADLLIALARLDQQRLAATRLSAGQLQRLEQATDQHVRGYYQLTTLPRLQVLLGDWATSRSLLELPQTPSERIRLTRTYARLTAILATLAFDHDQSERARALLETAQDAAHEAGDLEMEAWILEQRGMLADWRRDPSQVIAFTDRGLQISGKAASLTSARLHARAAAAHASLGDRRAAATHLQAAEHILDSSPASGCWPAAPAMPRVFTFSTDAMVVASAKTHLLLGDYPRTVELCQQATRLQHEQGLSARSALGVALNRLRLSTALLHLGELDHAQQEAMAAVRDYRGVAVALLLRRARDLARDLSTSDPVSSRGREFAEFLHSHATSIRPPR